MTSQGAPDRLLLLYTDRSDPVARAILDHGWRFDREVIAITLGQLVHEVVPGPCWRWLGRTIDPAATAVVNRLVLPPDDRSGPLASYFAERQWWGWLHRELGRFRYSSAMPTPVSTIGGFGSLLDQWLDLPAQFDDVRVPVHRPPWVGEPLRGDVCWVDPSNLYSLGTRLAPGDEPPAAARLAYLRPSGRLVHVAQVGGAWMVANAPSDLHPVEQASIVAFADAVASRSATRILEHAFFVGGGLPVLYSTCPTPVITGSLPDYPSLLVQGLSHDIDRYHARAAA